MIRFFKLSLLISLLLFLISCSEKKVYDKAELYTMGVKVDPKLEIVLPKDIASGVNCADYGQGCLRGFEVKHRELSMFFIEYDTSENAENFAKTINGYTARNWLIDDAFGEPILEEFVQKAFNAKLILINGSGKIQVQNSESKQIISN